VEVDSVQNFFFSGFACMPRFSVAVLSVFEFGIHPIANNRFTNAIFIADLQKPLLLSILS